MTCSNNSLYQWRCGDLSVIMWCEVFRENMLPVLVHKMCICAVYVPLLTYFKKLLSSHTSIKRVIFSSSSSACGLWYFATVWPPATVSQGVIDTSYFSVHVASDVTKMDACMLLSWSGSSHFHKNYWFSANEDQQEWKAWSGVIISTVHAPIWPIVELRKIVPQVNKRIFWEVIYFHDFCSNIFSVLS